MRVPQFAEVPICPEEYLLCDVLRIGFVPYLLIGVGVDHVLILVYEHTKGVSIPCEGFGH